MANSDWVHADRDFQNAPMFVRIARWLKYRTSRGISDPIHIEIDMGRGRRSIADVFVIDLGTRFSPPSHPSAHITVETSVGHAVLRCTSADAFADALGWTDSPSSHAYWDVKIGPMPSNARAFKETFKETDDG